MHIGRRAVIKAGMGLGAAMLFADRGLFAQAEPLIQKKIPSSGESIPVIGIGTARRYEKVKTDPEKAPLRETLRQFQLLGGKVIDSSPSYGTAEAVVGELVDGLKIRDSLFLATKVSLRKVGREEGIKQIEDSFKKYRTNKIDLIAVHNLRDTGTQLRTLREMQTAVREIYVDSTVSDYIVRLVNGTRIHPDVYLGASPRGSIALYRAGQALAGLLGRDYVIPDDIKALAEPALAHRIIIKTGSSIHDIQAGQVVRELLDSTSIENVQSTGQPGGPRDLRSPAGGAAGA